LDIAFFHQVLAINVSIAYFGDQEGLPFKQLFFI